MVAADRRNRKNVRWVEASVNRALEESTLNAKTSGDATAKNSVSVPEGSRCDASGCRIQKKGLNCSVFLQRTRKSRRGETRLSRKARFKWRSFTVKNGLENHYYPSRFKSGRRRFSFSTFVRRV